MKKISFFLISLVVLLGSCSDVIEDNFGDSFKNSPSFGVEIKDQSEVINAYNELMEHFSGYKTRSYSSDMSENVYPDYYGGCFADDSSNLIVYIKKDYVSLRSEVLNEINPHIIMKPCEYSYNTLCDIIEKINIYLEASNDNSIVDNISSVQLMDMQNNVKVTLFDTSEENINSFKQKVVNSPAIVYEKAIEPISSYTTLYPGCGFYGYAGGFSFGYRARRSGVDGFITAGHCLQKGDMVVYDGYQIGKCVAWQYSGKVDAAFCEEMGATLSNYILNSSYSHGTYVQPVFAGLNVYKSGARTYLTQGIVTSTNASFQTEDRVNLTDMAGATYVSDHGDSGGIVFSYTGLANVCGIVQGGDHVTSYFVKATNINAAFSCTVY